MCRSTVCLPWWWQLHPSCRSCSETWIRCQVLP